MNESRPIGRIKWIVRDLDQDIVLSEDDCPIWLENIEIEIKRPDDSLDAPFPFNFLWKTKDTYVYKEINLDDRFKLKISHRLASEWDLDFFSLHASEDEIGAPSGFDMFKIDKPNHAVSMRCRGELAFEDAKVEENFEIVKTEFLADTSVLMQTFDNFRLDLELLKLRTGRELRTKIAKGSIIHWPSLIDGEVVPNGFLEE
jgi:hypothetical protein